MHKTKLKPNVFLHGTVGAIAQLKKVYFAKYTFNLPIIMFLVYSSRKYCQCNFSSNIYWAELVSMKACTATLLW